MEALIQNLIQDFKAVVSEQDELNFREISELTALLQFLDYQDSICDVEMIF